MNDDRLILRGDDILQPGALGVGSYVVVSLDPVTSLQVLRDPIVDAATSRMETRKYVGVVLDIYPWPHEHRPLLKVNICLVGPEPPPQKPGSPINDTMYTPIYPTVDHVIGREPIHTNKPLPWPKCYHYSIMPMMVCATVIDCRYSSVTVISEREVSRLKQNIEIDRQAHLKSSRYPKGIDDDENLRPSSIRAEQAPSTHILAFSDDQSDFYFHGGSAAASEILDGNNQRGDRSAAPSVWNRHATSVRMRTRSDLSIIPPIQHVIEKSTKRPSPRRSEPSFYIPYELTGTVYLDLGLVADLPDPYGMIKEKAYIDRLAEEWLERVRREQRLSSKEAQIADWIRTSARPPENENDGKLGIDLGSKGSEKKRRKCKLVRAVKSAWRCMTGRKENTTA